MLFLSQSRIRLVLSVREISMKKSMGLPTLWLKGTEDGLEVSRFDARNFKRVKDLSSLVEGIVLFEAKLVRFKVCCSKLNRKQL